MTELATTDGQRAVLGFQALVQQKKELDAAIKTQAEGVLKNGAKALFEMYPFLGAFGWVQYTPNFNDGEPCRFTRGETFLISADDLPDDADERSNRIYEAHSDEKNSDIFNEWEIAGNYKDFPLHRQVYRHKHRDIATTTVYNWNRDEYELVDNPKFLNTPEARCFADVTEFVGLFDTALLEQIFGEYGAQVTITRQGVETTEYDCGY